jgi:hypothetical protein
MLLQVQMGGSADFLPAVKSVHLLRGVPRPLRRLLPRT